MTEHPVTLGDLRVVINEDPATPNEAWWSPATVADLVSALRAEGVLGVKKITEFALERYCKDLLAALDAYVPVEASTPEEAK